MPLSPTQSSWPAVFDSDGNQTAESKFKVKTLGNLTLLSGNRNIRASNRSFDTKRATYSGSDLLIVKDLGSKESWRLPEIQERQSELNRLACQAWPQYGKTTGWSFYPS